MPVQTTWEKAPSFTKRKCYSLKLKNSSKWPTWFVRFMVMWIWRQVEPRSKAPQSRCLTLRVRNTKRVRHGRAWWYYSEVTLSCARRIEKKHLNDRYYRYVWSAEHQLLTPVEMLVKIIAHELRHLDADQKGISKQGAEYDAEHWAWERVLEWREKHREFMAKLKTLARKHHG